MGLGDLVHFLGQSMSGQARQSPFAGQPGQQQDSAQGGQPDQRKSPFADWTQEPVQNGMGFAQAPQLPQRNSGILQSVLGDQPGAGAGPMGGGGLHEILMRLGLFR